MKILDATCSFRSIWLEKHNKDTTYIDIRPEVKPDIVMDSTKTTFADRTFDMILFDPPHRKFSEFMKSLGKRSMAFRYGSQTTAERRAFVAGAFREFYRILKDDGVVMFKWNDCGTKFATISKEIHGWVPMWGQNFNPSRSNKLGVTTWMCYRKDLDGSQRVIE